MPNLLEKPPTTEQPFVEAHGGTSRRKILPISLLIGCILTITVASLNYVTKSDEEKLEALQAMIDRREPLKDYEKEAYCDLLWKVKQIRLCACKKNFIKDIGSLTGYKVKDSDLDWRGSQKTFEEALEEAFRRTGIPKEQFVPKKWGKDINGKSGVVQCCTIKDFFNTKDTRVFTKRTKFMIFFVIFVCFSLSVLCGLSFSS